MHDLTAKPKRPLEEHQFLQTISGMTINTTDVLRFLRNQIRTICELPIVPIDTPLNGAELAMIYSICHHVHNGPARDVLLRSRFRMSDVDYTYRTGELPYYVMRTFDVCDIQPGKLSQTQIDLYKVASELSTMPVPSQESAVLKRHALAPSEE